MNGPKRVTTRATNGEARDGVQTGEVTWQSYAGSVGVIVGIGLGTLGLHLYHLFTQSEELYARLLGTLLPMVLSIVLLAIGLRIHRHRYEDIVVRRVGSWSLTGTVVLVGVSVVSIAHQQSLGVLVADPLFVVVDHATVGAILGSVMGIYDGQRNRRGRQLRAERERARRLNTQVTILGRVLRHDIRTAVNVIVGYTELLSDGDVDLESATNAIDTRAQELQTMSERARKIERLIEQESLQPVAMDLGPRLRGLADALEADHPDVEFRTQLPESVTVRAISLIDAAVEELLVNAIKHNDADTPRVELAVAAQSPQRRADQETRDVVTIRVRDNGPGIPDSQIEVLERGQETDLKHMSGIGLWFVSWIVDISGGQITFEAREAGGSVVEIRLATAVTPDGAQSDRRRVTPVQTGSGAVAAGSDGETVQESLVGTKTRRVTTATSCSVPTGTDQ